VVLEEKRERKERKKKKWSFSIFLREKRRQKGRAKIHTVRDSTIKGVHRSEILDCKDQDT